MLISTKIFLDGGDPEETREADEILKHAGFKGIEGQTTNPSLIAKRALHEAESKSGKSSATGLTPEAAAGFYRNTVVEMAKHTDGPISIQVIGDPDSMTVEDMLYQAREKHAWIPNAAIKFPCTRTGLEAAEAFCSEGMVNMTLVFSQDQAAAVYAATKHAAYPVFVSPFVGRLDDRGEDGMDIVSNTLQMYRGLGDGHVWVLTASVRNLDHLMYALFVKSDAVTVPLHILTAWQETGFTLPDSTYMYHVPHLNEIPYKELSLEDRWQEYDISHDLTEAGIRSFWQDWSSALA